MITKYIFYGRMSIYSTCVWSLSSSLLFLSNTLSTKSEWEFGRIKTKQFFHDNDRRYILIMFFAFINDMCFILLFVTSQIWYFNLTFGTTTTVSSALSIFDFWYCSDLILFLVFRASYVKNKIRNLYFSLFPCFLPFESWKMVVSHEPPGHLRLFDIYLFSCMLHAYAFLFTFASCVVLIIIIIIIWF